MTERTYTWEEIKQAFQNAYAWGWYDACAEAEIRHRIDIGPLNERRAQQHNPYEPEAS